MPKYGSFKYSQQKYGLGPIAYADKDINKVVRNLNITSANGQIVLNWGEPINPTGISQYNIYRAYTKDLSFQNIGFSLTTGYTDSGTENRRDYYYSVTSVYSGLPIISDYIPQNLTLSLQTGFSPPNLVLDWRPPISGVFGYRIWRSTDWTSNFSGIATTTGIRYIDSGLDTNYPYYYRITSLF